MKNAPPPLRGSVFRPLRFRFLHEVTALVSFWSRRPVKPVVALAGLLLACQAACDPPPEPPITLQVGPTQVTSFEPRAAFAHYYELPGHEDVLRIVLSSYPVGCQEFEPPEPGEAYITVTIKAPPTTTIEAGEFRWEGLSGEGAEEENKAPEPYALPFIRLSEEGRPLPPGGAVKITKIQKEPLGLVEGQLAFRDGGDQQASTTALMGDFSLRLCHTELDPARAAQQEDE